MRLLVLSPDYASHHGPLLVLARRARTAGWDVVVATGPAMASSTVVAGFEHRRLELGRERNDGRTSATSRSMDDFVDATRHGMLATLLHQAARRREDLLWEPRRVVADVARLCDDVRPDLVLVDHVSLASTLALLTTGRPFLTFVPGHPSQLPVGDERFGVPASWPSVFRADPVELDLLRRSCDAVHRSVTETFAAVLAAAGRAPPTDAFAVHGDVVLHPWPTALHDPQRAPLLPAHVDVGPVVRAEAPDAVTSAWLRRDPGLPLAVVALGTFLSRRDDVLATLAAGFRDQPLRVALATGGSDPADLGPLPDHWLVQPVLQQVALLDRATVAVSHAGGGSAGEALAAGVPQLLLPFSTDQFAVAADLERLGVAVVADPNALSPAAVAEGVDALLDAARATPVAELAESCRAAQRRDWLPVEPRPASA